MLNLQQYFHNEMCFKLKYIDDIQSFESNYTRPVKAQMDKKGQVIFRWVENFPNNNEENKDNMESDTLEFILVNFFFLY